jgi:hypothetical protein
MATIISDALAQENSNVPDIEEPSGIPGEALFLETFLSGGVKPVPNP